MAFTHIETGKRRVAYHLNDSQPGARCRAKLKVALWGKQ